MISLATYGVLLSIAAAPIARDDISAAKKSGPVGEVRKVVAAIVLVAEENAGRGGEKLQGDILFETYVRRAAAVARDEHLSPRAFLIGLGVALDHTSFLRRNPLIRPYLVQIESEEERQRRLKVIGRPTLRRREDWPLHFAIAAALTAHLSPEAAERLSIAKEVLDAQGTSGFSFADLAADYAGIALANRLLEADGEKRLSDLVKAFKGDDYLPMLNDLEDGLPWEDFTQKYGGITDPRFLRHCEAIRKRVLNSPGFQTSKEKD